MTLAVQPSLFGAPEAARPSTLDLRPYQQDAKKGAPWDRILAEREKLAAKAQ